MSHFAAFFIILFSICINDLHSCVKSSNFAGEIEKNW